MPVPADPVRIEECEHDWRVDPFIILTSNPPQRRLVCIKCGKSKASGLSLNGPTVLAHDPSTWEKWR